MAAQVFWAFFSNRQQSQVGPTADFDDFAIPPPTFSMNTITVSQLLALGSSTFQFKDES